MSYPISPREATPRLLIWVLVLTTLLGAAVFLPLAPWLVLALWFAALVRPAQNRFARVIHGRHRAAAVLTVALFLVCAVPVAIGVASLSTDAVLLARKVMQSEGGRGMLRSIVTNGDALASGGEVTVNPESIVGLVEQHGLKAWQVLATAAGAATNALVGLFVFFWGAYVSLAEGPKAYAWFTAHVPLDRRYVARFTHAFIETGRGLLVGVGLTGLVQALLATIAYFALGVPRALVLGLFTLIASVIPSFGCALVWTPVAAGLALSGQPGRATILLVVGVVVVSTVDNVLRPIFSRYGHLRLSSYVIIVSMFGGLALLGPWGLLLGPLFVRLAKEAMEIGAEERMAMSASDAAEGIADGASTPARLRPRDDERAGARRP